MSKINNVSLTGKDNKEGSLTNTKTGKVKLGETVIKTHVFFKQLYHEFPCYRSLSGITHTSPKMHLKSLVVLLGDTKLQKEKPRPFSFTCREKKNLSHSLREHAT